MTGSERRDQIINQIKKSSIPVSGAQLAKEFDVSRQVIVQDIALIRAAGHERFARLITRGRNIRRRHGR